MKKLLLATLLLIGGCGSGHRTFDQAMESLDKWREIAKEHNVQWEAELESRGDGVEVYAKEAFGINTGITLRIRIRGDTDDNK